VNYSPDSRPTSSFLHCEFVTSSFPCLEIRYYAIIRAYSPDSTSSFRAWKFSIMQSYEPIYSPDSTSFYVRKFGVMQSQGPSSDSKSYVLMHLFRNSPQQFLGLVPFRLEALRSIQNISESDRDNCSIVCNLCDQKNSCIFLPHGC